MNATTQPQSDAVGPRPSLAGVRVKESTLRQVIQLAAAVVLVAAGVLMGIYVNPELAATLVTAGVHTAIDAFGRSRDEHRKPRHRATSEFALGLS